MWRLVLEGVGTLTEIEAHWSITDVLDANEALDVQGDVTEWRRRQAKALHEHEQAQARAVRGLTGGR